LAFLNTVIKIGHKIFCTFLDQLSAYKFSRKNLLSVVTKENASVSISIGFLDRRYGSHCSLKYYSPSELHEACGVHINPHRSLELDSLVYNSTVIYTEGQTSGR
jgi:hypothetical protein